MMKFPHELIGKRITILKASNDSLQGISGVVIDETKETINVDGKIIMKGNITFKINETGQIIEGNSLMKRPEDRIKGR